VLYLGAWAFSSVTEQLCPESRAAEDPSPLAHTAARYRPNNCTQSRQLPHLLGPDSPNNYSFSGQNAHAGSLPTPNNHSVLQPDQAGHQPEKRTMAGFCGFGGSPKPDEPGIKPEPEALGKPEPESPRHPRK